ncbi:cadherin EGF LAG seven-pass G-type receptor 3 [Gouania willdenowi]|uniref:cadherin EGF LAG seven-pass G-type receptor 3 n=1 Tax=Gouania willdenowi TaxID=441366 RepID=UPI0010565D41|nr:cadherin EGF LAG seven-pass G-type receptor 3-like [Gouania willdenowi]
MAALLPGFTPILLLLLPSLVLLHLHLSGPLFALSPGTVHTGGAASHTWTRGLCDQQAGKVILQHRAEAGLSWDRCPSRCTSERVEAEGCPGGGGAETGRMEERKGVVPALLSPDLTPLPPPLLHHHHHLHTRPVQRRRPHLVQQRAASGAPVHGLVHAPGRVGGRCEGEVMGGLTPQCSPGPSPDSAPSPGPSTLLPLPPPHHPISPNLIFTDDSAQVRTLQLDYIRHFSACNPADEILHPCVYSREEQVGGHRGAAANCSHLGMHNVIHSCRVGGDDSKQASGIMRGGDTGAPAVITHIGSGFPAFSDARIWGEERGEVEDGRGEGGLNCANNHINTPNYSDQNVAFLILTHPQRRKADLATQGHGCQTQAGPREGPGGGCFGLVGGGCFSDFNNSEKSRAQMNSLHSDFTEAQRVDDEIISGYYSSMLYKHVLTERVNPQLTVSAQKVRASSNTACDSGVFPPVELPVTATRSQTLSEPLTQLFHHSGKHLNFSSDNNQTTWQHDHKLSAEVVISEHWTARGQPVYLWSTFNNNNNNNRETKDGDHGNQSKADESQWFDQPEVVRAVSSDSVSTEHDDHTHVELKSRKQVPLRPQGLTQQMEAGGESEREEPDLEGSGDVAVWGGKLQVGEGKGEALLTEGRGPRAGEEVELVSDKGVIKSSQAERREGGKGQDRGSSAITQPDSEGGRKENQEVGQGGGMEVKGEEGKKPSLRGGRSLERLINVAEDDSRQREMENKLLMYGPRSRRAANRQPQFSLYNYQVQVAENQPPGTSVIVMTATDTDAGDAGKVSYSMAPLMNSRSSDYFHIHPDTGIITSTQILDREHMDLHYFRITATDFGIPRLSGTTMVAITVSDRNDHSPMFEQSEYRETIRENVEEGYPILQLRATDADSPSNANIRYRFVGDSATVARAAFEVDPRSGLITTRGSVDREANEHYTLQVEANDQGKDPGPRSANVKVFITVLDENDNVPQFSEKRYVVAVKEDVRPHSEILRVSAVDRDKDSNAAVHYNIISGNSRGQFSIDSVTGEIQVVAPLDYESEREYTLRVRAQDNGRPPLSNNTGIVSVQVTDVNDNPPIFVSTPFQASVLESAPVGSSILHIQAIDTDSGDNARLEYRLTGTSSDTPFVINSATGWVTVSSILDRESVEHYFFGVEARDYGMPPLSATASVTITVMDVNDNRPEFLQKEYYSRLNEDAVVGTSVVTVTAVDRDVNSAVTYQITGGNTRNRFAISTAGGAGLLTLALPLDYKQERRYVLTVTASDRTLHDTCQVHINITDANTHRPVFQSAHYSVSVNEDRPPGSTVVVISATDDDVGENARITYFLEDNIPQFRIDTSTGAITLQAELDYEDQMTYTLAITAKDNGIPQKSDTTYVEVNVNDVNDNAPQFLSPRYQGTVSEDAPPFTSVLQISATDRDAHANGRVQYTFQNGEDGDGDFTIEPTSGIVRTFRRLDRESVPFYELTAYAVDRGVPPQKTPVHIQVTVLDVNDNAPVFPADDFEVLVKENSAVGSVVAQITATDPDEGANAQIMYQIVEGNIPEIFQMDIFSGELTSLIDLDYESRNEYVIVVQATSAPLVSRATVRIKLLDQNDNEPTLQHFQIIFNNFVSNRSNSFPSGVIGRVPAHDPDVSDRLYYTIDRGNELHLLLLNHTSGEIRLSRKLDNNRPLVAPMLITVTERFTNE